VCVYVCMCVCVFFDSVLYCVVQGLCSVYEKYKGEIGASTAELIEAYQKLMSLFPRLGLSYERK